jgi:hypothetical protein
MNRHKSEKKMDTELLRQIKETQEKITEMSAELDVLLERANAGPSKVEKKEQGLYRTLGVVEPDLPSNTAKAATKADRKKREKPWTTDELLSRAGLLKEKEFLRDPEYMTKMKERAYKAAKEVDAVEAFRMYEEIMQMFEPYPPCTFNAWEYLEWATFKRDIKNDEENK